MTGSDLCIPRNEIARQRYFKNKIIMFHIHVSVSDLYIPRICLPDLLQPNSVGIGNEEIHKSDVRYSVYGM